MGHLLLIIICISLFRLIKGDNNGCLLNLIKGTAAAILLMYLVALILTIVAFGLALLIGIVDTINHI